MSSTISQTRTTLHQLAAEAARHTAAAKAAPTAAEAAPHLKAAGQCTAVLMDCGVTAEQFTEMVAAARQSRFRFIAYELSTAHPVVLRATKARVDFGYDPRHVSLTQAEDLFRMLAADAGVDTTGVAFIPGDTFTTADGNR